MNLTDFFELVLPSTGHIILAVPNETKGYRHYTFLNLDEAVDKAVELNFEHFNVFFALAGFKAERVWNATLQKYQKRTQANAGWLRSLFLDFDIDPNPGSPDKAAKVYTTREDALDALDALVAKLKLPRPLILNSGGGWHAYWPFDADLPKEEWQGMADKFKAICQSESLRIDPAVPADAARVLRPLGCHNLKRDTARPVEVHDQGDGATPAARLKMLLDAYEQNFGIALPKRVHKTSAVVASGGLLAGGSVARTGDPLNFGLVAFGCPVVGGQMACGGAGTTEPLWRAVLGLAKHAHEPIKAMLSVSDQHADFHYDTMVAKAQGWNAGPTTCNYFKTTLDCPECQTCPHNFTSPAQLGRMKEEAAPPVEKTLNLETGEEEEEEVIAPPAPYLFYDNPSTKTRSVVMKSEDKDGNPVYKDVSPNEFYPVRILRNSVSGEISERTLWRFNIPRLPPFTSEIKQSLLSDSKGLQAFLNNLGVYAHTDEIKAIQLYMSAYLKHLAAVRDRERVYTRLGWQFDNDDADKRIGYVVGQRMFNTGGTIAACNLSQGAKNTIKNSLNSKGSLAEWSRWMNTHYTGDIYKAHRFFIYASFAAPLMHMTGEKGALITASGRSGRGKTTALRASSSIWGHPDALILNGNPQGATSNATENHLGTLHSLPMMWDDTTNLGTESVLKFALNISQGVGKQRMKGSDHDGRSVSWETLVLSSTNYDDVSQALAAQSNVDAHLMRIISVPFVDFNDTTEGAKAAEQFKRGISENYGLACVPFMQYVTANYDAVKARVTAAEDAAWDVINAKGPERYWAKVIGVLRVASEIVRDLGLLDFPIDSDYLWMGDHIEGLRQMHNEYRVSPTEELAAFLEERISETLVLSSKATSNLDNVAHMPQRVLSIRHEMDRGLIFIAKAAVGIYCAEKNESLKHWEDQLVAAGVLLDRSKQKTLGADTKHAKGQVRCWVVDANRLGAQFAANLQQAIAAPSNVVPLAGVGT
jgi:hypothetical protein